MNFKRLSIATLQALGLGLMPTAALATTDTTTFTATVPGACTYTYANGVDEAVAMAYDSVANTLSGESSGISVTCNFVASATLGAVTAVNEPVGLTTTAEATLKSGESIITTSDKSAGSSSTSIANTLNEAKPLSVSLDIGGATAQGSYEYTVVLTVLDTI